MGARLDEPVEFLRPNDGFSERGVARREVVRWKGAEDEEIEGILYYPFEHEEGKRYPLIAMPHGGPHAADRDRFSQRWAYVPHFYAERGAFCLFVNYHGSSGYGLAFGESIKGRYYELEVEDILSGIDAQVEAGRVDPDRLGLAGWSNGAILSIGCLTLADTFAKDYAHYRFRACAPGAGDVNWTSDYGNCAFGVRFDDFYLGGPPWKLPDVYLKKSPLFHVEKVETPTLIFFGSEDRAVPTEQGWQWYRALQQVGKAPVRFLLFPGQPHGLNKPSFRARKIEEELAWFDRYLFEKAPGSDLVLDDESPLAAALARTRYKRVKGALGADADGLLVPETVDVGGLSVGRFEVTRAQWGAVFPDTPRAPGDADLPVCGVSAEEALEYVKRLSRATGQTWRLLSEKELAKLPKGPEENTLDWWVGFAPAPRDARRLAAMASDLPGPGGLPPLVEPVGKRRPGLVRLGDRVVRVHDVGGNVGEWVLGENGKPVLKGPAAWNASDDRNPDRGVLMAYAGLRVAREQP